MRLNLEYDKKNIFDSKCFFQNKTINLICLLINHKECGSNGCSTQMKQRKV